MKAHRNKQQSTAAARKRLERLQEAARTVVAVLAEIDELGLEALLLRNRAPFDIVAERERAARLAERAMRAVSDAPRPGHRPQRNTSELIRALAAIYRRQIKKQPTSTPGGPFEKLVRTILQLKSSSKEITAALSIGK